MNNKEYAYKEIRRLEKEYYETKDDVQRSYLNGKIFAYKDMRDRLSTFEIIEMDNF